MRAREVVAWAIGLGPATCWVVALVAWQGPRLGYPRAAVLALVTGMGVLGLSALFLAWFPFLVERLGFRRLGAFLRRFWDEDAR